MKRMLYIVACYDENDDVPYYEVRPNNPRSMFIMDLCDSGLENTLGIDALEEGDWMKVAYEVVPWGPLGDLTGKFLMRFEPRRVTQGGGGWVAYCKVFRDGPEGYYQEVYCPKDATAFLRPDQTEEAWQATLEIIEYS